MKTCKKCGEIKPEAEFSKDTHSKDGKQSRCKQCQNAWSKNRNNSAKTEGAKFCRGCSTIKSILEFSKNKRTSDGRDTQCKLCVRNRSANHYKNNKTRYRIRATHWVANNHGHIMQYAQQWRDSHRDKMSEYGKRWYANNRELALAKDKKARDTNREKFLARENASYARHKLTRMLRGIKWRKANPDKICAYAAKRRSAIRHRTPRWLTIAHFKEIETFYTEALRLRNATGENWHVDHIVPLRGKKVSGLHVPWNLQVLPAIINLKKTNKHEP